MNNYAFDNDLFLTKEVADRLSTFICSHKNFKSLIKKGIVPPNIVVITGEEGCGGKLIAETIASELGLKFDSDFCFGNYIIDNKKKKFKINNCVCFIEEWPSVHKEYRTISDQDLQQIHNLRHIHNVIFVIRRYSPRVESLLSWPHMVLGFNRS